MALARALRSCPGRVAVQAVSVPEAAPTLHAKFVLALRPQENIVFVWVSEHVPVRAVQYRHLWQRRAGKLMPAPPGGEPVAPILFRLQVWSARAGGPERRRRSAYGGGRRATPRRRFGRGLATPDAQ